MNRTGVIAISIVVLTAACGGMAGDELTGGPRRSSTPAGGSDPAVDPAAQTNDPDAAASTPASDASVPDSGAPKADAGSDAAAPVTAFTGAGAYVATLGPTTIKGAHNAFPNNNPVKQNCDACHNGDFFAGGSVFKDAAGTMPAPSVEVRFRASNGNAISRFTDANGNFFVTMSAAVSAGVTYPALVGVRDGTTTKVMNTMITTGACNTAACHAGAQGWAHVP